MLDLLPTDLSLTILREWLLGCPEGPQAKSLGCHVSPAGIAVLSKIDTAFTNHGRRGWVYSVISKVPLRQLCVTSQNLFAWLHSRGLALRSVEVDICTLSEFTHFDTIPPLSSVVSITLTNMYKYDPAVPLGDFVALYPNLTELDALSCSSLHDSAFLQLLDISSPLRSLLLPSGKSDHPCSGSCLTLLAKFAPTLERIHCSHLSDQALVSLSHSLHNLKTLALLIDQVAASDSLLHLLRANPRLEYIYCDYNPALLLPRRCPIDDSFVTQLTTLCPRIHYLFLPTCTSTFRSMLTILDRCAALQRAYCGDVELDITYLQGKRHACRLTLGESISLEEAKTILSYLSIPLTAFQFGRNINSLMADAALIRLIAQHSLGRLTILNLNVDSRVPRRDLEALFSHCPLLSHLYLTIVYPAQTPSTGVALSPVERGSLALPEARLSVADTSQAPPQPVLSLVMLGQYCKQLREIALRDARMTDSMAEEILRACQACPLVEVSFQGCTLLTYQIAERVVEYFPQLWMLDMSETSMTKRERCLLLKSVRRKVHLGP